MDAVVSPYDLSTQSHGAMAALMLGDRCVTYLPLREDEIDPEGIEAAAARSPRFEGLLRHWSWSLPLWRGGVLTAAGLEGAGGRSLGEEVAGVVEEVGRDPALAALRGSGGAVDAAAFLDDASRDFVRGGGDPAVSVPVMAGLERYAAGAGLWLFQSPSGSMVGRLERRLGRALFSTTAPFPKGASGEALLDARDLLDDELGALRGGMEECVAMVRAGALAEDVSSFGREVIEPAARAYEEAFGERCEEFMWGEGGRRGAVSLRLTVSMMARDTTLVAARSAAAVLGRRRGSSGAARSSAGAATGIAPVGGIGVSVKALPWDVG